MKRYWICLSAICLGLCGCSENQENDVNSCNPAAFQPLCTSQTSYLGCINGTASVQNCPVNQSCSNGVCVPAGVSQQCILPIRCDGNALVSCYNGVENRILCPNGCENNACRTAVQTCTPGVMCIGSELVVCGNGSETRIPCANGCDNNLCRDVAKSCSPDGVKCDGNALVTCINGVENRQPCLNGCENNACRVMPQGCSPDGVKCEGVELVTCSNGTESRQVCPNGCENNACKSAPAGCSPDGVKCEGNELVTCSSGTESRQVCPNGCENNACKSASVACTPDGVKCDGNVLVTCSNGFESRQTCTNGCENNACNPVSQECGNGVREGNEVCDGDDLGEMTCHDVQGSNKSWIYTGKPECSSSCDDIIGPGTCERTFCGNNKLDLGENEFCDVVDGVSVFKDPVSCEALSGYGDRTWKPGGQPGCSVDCKALKKGTCTLEAQPQGGIDMCHFVDLIKDENTKEVTGHVRVTPIAGVTQELISGRLACGTRANETYKWGDAAARHQECPDCKEGEYQLVSELDYSLRTPGDYDCVFKIFVNTSSLPGGSESTSYYNCPITPGFPFEEGIPEDEVIRSFTADASAMDGVLLAKWDFAGYEKFQTVTSVKASDGVFASESTISLSDGGKMTMYTNGDFSNMAASGTDWSTATVLSMDTAKYFSIKTSTTGYKNIRLQYIVAGSSEKITKHVTTALNVLNIVKPVGETLVFADDRVPHQFPMTVLPDAESQKQIEIRIYPYGVASGTTVRVDDIYVIGDAI